MEMEKKSPCIPWKIIKQFTINIHEHIIKIYEYCLNKGIYPSIWKKRCIITIPKADTDHSTPCNYRPITLLPVLGRIFEKIIRAKISDKMEKEIPNFRFGFHSGKCTTYPLLISVSNT